MSSAAGEIRGYRPSEIATAAFAALSVLVWSVVLLSLSALGKEAAAADIGVPDEIPIEVKPVLDLDSPLLKGKGGKKYKAKVPKEWAKTPPPRKATAEQPEPGEAKTQVSTKAKDDAEAIPDDDNELVDGKTDDDDGNEAAGGGRSERGGGGGEPISGTGEGGSPGDPNGTDNPDDPLKALALTNYRNIVIGFFRGGFACGPDVPDDVRQSCTPTAVFSVAGDGTVTSVSFSPCGNAAVDGPASASANGKKGAQLPPAPEKYPEFLLSSWTVTYRCPQK